MHSQRSFASTQLHLVFEENNAVIAEALQIFQVGFVSFGVPKLPLSRAHCVCPDVWSICVTPYSPDLEGVADINGLCSACNKISP